MHGHRSSGGSGSSCHSTGRRSSPTCEQARRPIDGLHRLVALIAACACNLQVSRADLPAITAKLDPAVESIVAAVEARAAAEIGTSNVTLTDENGTSSTYRFSRDGRSWAWIYGPGPADGPRVTLCENGAEIRHIEHEPLLVRLEYNTYLFQSVRFQHNSIAAYLLTLNAAPRQFITELSAAGLKFVGETVVDGRRVTHLHVRGRWPVSEMDLYFDPERKAFLRVDSLTDGNDERQIWVDQWSDKSATGVEHPRVIKGRSFNLDRPESGDRNASLLVSSFEKDVLAPLTEARSVMAETKGVFVHLFETLSTPQSHKSQARADSQPSTLAAVIESSLQAGQVAEAMTAWASLDSALPDKADQAFVLAWVARFHLPQWQSSEVSRPEEQQAWVDLFRKLIQVPRPLVGDASPAISAFVVLSNTPASASLEPLLPELIDSWASSCDSHSVAALRSLGTRRPELQGPIDKALAKWAASDFLSKWWGYHPAAGQVALAIDESRFSDAQKILDSVKLPATPGRDVTETVAALKGLLLLANSGDPPTKLGDSLPLFAKVWRDPRGEPVGNGAAVEVLASSIAADTVRRTIADASALNILVATTKEHPEVVRFWLAAARRLASTRSVPVADLETGAGEVVITSDSELGRLAIALETQVGPLNFKSRLALIEVPPTAVESLDSFASAYTLAADDFGRIEVLRSLYGHAKPSDRERAVQIIDQLTSRDRSAAVAAVVDDFSREVLESGRRNAVLAASGAHERALEVADNRVKMFKAQLDEAEQKGAGDDIIKALAAAVKLVEQERADLDSESK